MVMPGIEPGHFQVDPHEIVSLGRHADTRDWLPPSLDCPAF
jgi:hypothetical protein